MNEKFNFLYIVLCIHVCMYVYLSLFARYSGGLLDCPGFTTELLSKFSDLTAPVTGFTMSLVSVKKKKKIIVHVRKLGMQIICTCNVLSCDYK